MGTERICKILVKKFESSCRLLNMVNNKFDTFAFMFIALMGVLLVCLYFRFVF